MISTRWQSDPGGEETMSTDYRLPAWAGRMRELYRSGSTSQFVLYGNVVDLVDAGPTVEKRFVSLRRFLTEVMFAPFDVIIHYDRGRGIRVAKGGDHVPPLPQGLRHLPGHLLGGAAGHRRRRRHDPRSVQPAAAGPAAGPRTDQPIRSLEPAAHPGRRRRFSGRGAPQSGGGGRLRPLHRPLAARPSASPATSPRT